MPETHDFGDHHYMHLQHYGKPTGATARRRHRRGHGPAVVALDIGRPPLTEVAQTWELEEPYRMGTGRAVRLWPSRWAVVVGSWGAPAQPDTSETVLLSRALNGAMLAVPASQIRQWPGPPADEEML